MSTINETGHARLVANFETLVNYCTNLGTAYNPVKASLKLTAIKTQLTNTRVVLSTVNNRLIDYRTAVDARVLAFRSIKKLSTRLIHALISSGSNDEIITDARSFQKKIQGIRAEALIKKSAHSLVNDDSDIFVKPEPKHVSASQLSYDNMVEHFARLVALITTQASYVPNETDLKLTTLNSYLTSLRTSNTDVINAGNVIALARVNRDQLLYHTSTGVCEIAKQIKSYLKAVYGLKSVSYLVISNLSFPQRKLQF